MFFLAHLDLFLPGLFTSTLSISFAFGFSQDDHECLSSCVRLTTAGISLAVSISHQALLVSSTIAPFDTTPFTLVEALVSVTSGTSFCVPL